ncbi:MAG: DivIVA domain-containing protein [Clostridiales bacterium]|nr:DivIVA domain-containing protein [Clostridiales bacterium]
MLTPQQIDQVSFGRSTFGGYDMQQVDEFLEPLTEDYVTLYKENALLKSKMRVLVGKLEEYRKNEASMKDAVINAQKTCDKMVAEAEAKCAKMLSNASAAAAPAAAPVVSGASSDALVAAENARVQEARKAAAAKISELQDQLKTCIQALERIKDANAPVPTPAPKAAPAPVESADVADEIAQNIEAMIGSTVDTAPKAAPKHPTNNDTTTSKFASLNLQFGRNYDPTSK